MPEGLIFLATVLLLRLDSLRETLVSLAQFYPAAVFATATFLALRFRRGRLLFSLVAIALAAYGPLAAGTAAGRHMMFDAVAVLLPLTLLALGLLPDKGILTPAGIFRWGALLAQVLVIATLSSAAPVKADAWFRASVLSGALIHWLKVPPPAILAFATAGALLLVLALREPLGPGRSTLWALAASLLAITNGRPGTAATFAFTSGALILAVAVIEASYHQVYEDALTELPGRRALNEELPRLGDQYVVAMVDVDHFKRFNDTFGHDVGDHVLRMVAAKLATVQGGGRSYRYGGEEFAILFPGRSIAEVLPALNEVREAVADTGFTVRRRLRPRKKPDAPRTSRSTRSQVSITISIGAAAAGGRLKRPEQVIQAADKALYQAKESGRNRVSTL
jgi:diguanylate cyclase (GGDEF)-like protein